MRIPDPIANTTTEAYLAYKAGVLAEGDLKPKLYDPYIHLDAWLAYWAGLTKSYPVKNVGKNLFDIDHLEGHYFYNSNTYQPNSENLDWDCSQPIPVESNTTYTISMGLKSGESFSNAQIIYWDANKNGVGSLWGDLRRTLTTGANVSFITIAYKNTTWENVQLEKGSTATAYEPYSGEPEMLTDEEALIAYLSGVTDTYPEEFRDPADVRVAAYLKYLVSARWGRPEYPVTNEELYLSMMDAPYIPAGEPSSDIEIDDTAEAPFKDVKMYGDTSQATYTGKNLFATPAGGLVNGVTFTLNPDGTYDISGTSTARAQIVLYTSAQLLENGETYTIKANQPLGDVIARVEAFNGESYLRANYILNSTTQQQTGAWNGTDATRCCFLLRVESGKTVNISGLGIQLERGSTATDFEPYVGGVPAPNPDYPQAIQTVTGRNVVNVIGKNLFDYTTYRQSGQGLTNTLNADGTITTTGVPNGDYVRIVPNLDITELLKDGETYTVSKTYSASYVGVQVQAQKIGGGRDYYNGTFTVDKSTHSYYIITAQTTTMEVWGSEPRTITCGYQLEKGSTTTDFEPYKGQSYEINLGKNLFDKNNANILVGTIGSTAISVGGSNKFLYIPCEPNTTYTVQKRNDGDTNRFSVATTSVLPAGGVSTSGFVQDNDASSITITTASDAKYIVVMYYRIQETTLTEQQLLDSIQIEVGSTPTSYAPYFTPIELCKIGDYQDYIYENEGKWYLHKAVRHLSLLPSNMNNYEDTPGWRDITQLSQDLGVDHNGTLATWTNYKCNVVLPDATTGLHFNINTIAQWNNNVLVVTGSGLTQTQWKNNYGSQACEVYYGVLNTSADTEITNTALIDQLNALKKGGSYTGTTYIKVSATDPNLPGLLEVEAYKYD